MKTTLAILLATIALLHADPIPVTLPNAVSVERTVTSKKTVEVSRVDVKRIVIDTETKQITFQTAEGNSTVTLDGEAYEAVSGAFRTQFATTIAPLIGAKLKNDHGLKQSGK